MKHIQSSKILLALLACAAGVATVVSMPAAAQSDAPAAAAAGAPGAASVPSSLNVAVGGTITPGSCKPTLAEIKFNETKVNGNSLKETAETPLPPVVQSFSITCESGDAAIALSVGGSSNLAVPEETGLTHTATGIVAEAKKGYIYDLVDQATSKERIGRYVFQFRNFRYTTTAANGKSTKTVVVTSADKATWATAADTATHASQLKSDGSTFVTFAESGQSTVPVAAKEFSGDIVIGAVIQPKTALKAALKISSDLAFYGTTTLVLSYI